MDAGVALFFLEQFSLEGRGDGRKFGAYLVARVGLAVLSLVVRGNVTSEDDQEPDGLPRCWGALWNSVQSHTASGS